MLKCRISIIYEFGTALVWNDCLYHHVPQSFFTPGAAVLLNLGVLIIKYMKLLIHTPCFNVLNSLYKFRLMKSSPYGS